MKEDMITEAVVVEETGLTRNPIGEEIYPHLPMIPADTHCNGRLKNGNYCRHPAGFKTLHAGRGRCYRHSGAMLDANMKRVKKTTATRYLKTGSLPKALGELIGDLQEDLDPLSIEPELAAIRALFMDFVSRYEEYREALLAWHRSFSADKKDLKPPKIMDISKASVMLKLIADIAQREKKLRLDGSISRREMETLIKSMWRVVEQHVQNETVQNYIKEDWLRLR